MRLSPFGARYLVVPDPPRETVRGIVRPETAEMERPTSGTIVAAGPEAKGYETGAHVVFAEWAGHSLTVDGRRVMFLMPSEILGVVNDAAV